MPRPTGFPREVQALLLLETCFRYTFFGIVGVFTIVAETAFSLTGPEARFWFHAFYAAAWTSAIGGGFLADRVSGRVGGKLFLLLVAGTAYSIGIFCVSGSSPTVNLVCLGLVAVGFGCAKPTITSLIGDKFSASEEKTRKSAFSYLYAATNLGALLAFVSMPKLVQAIGVQSAARAQAALAFLAVIVAFYFLRRSNCKSYEQPAETVASVAKGAEVQERTLEGSRDGFWLAGIIGCLCIFWAAYNQTHSVIVQQAKEINRYLLGIEWTPDQFQALNPLCVVLLTPLLSKILKRSSDLQNMLYGFLLAIPYLVLCLWFQREIDTKGSPSATCLIAIYALASVAEVFLLSSYNLFYTFAKKRKALALGFLFASIGVGEVFSAILNSIWKSYEALLSWGNIGYLVVLTGILILATTVFALLILLKPSRVQ